MKKTVNLSLFPLLLLCACQAIPARKDNPSTAADSLSGKPYTLTNTGITDGTDTFPDVFVAMLKPGLGPVRAIINDSTIFIAQPGQLLLYWNYPHQALIADGRSGYIAPQQIMPVDTPYFKFNFATSNFEFESDYELYIAAKRTGADLNPLTRRIRHKDQSALLQFFRLKDVVDGAAAEEFEIIFWKLINLWTDKELSSFISTLEPSEKKSFCELLIQTSFCDPFAYYARYYPLTLEHIHRE